MKEFKTIHECICTISMEDDIFDYNWVNIAIGELAYDKYHIANCLFIRNYHDINKLTPEIVNEMYLGFYDDESEFWHCPNNIKVNEIKDEKLRTKLIEAVMERYAELLLEG